MNTHNCRAAAFLNNNELYHDFRRLTTCGLPSFANEWGLAKPVREWKIKHHEDKYLIDTIMGFPILHGFNQLYFSLSKTVTHNPYRTTHFSLHYPVLFPSYFLNFTPALSSYRNADLWLVFGGFGVKLIFLYLLRLSWNFLKILEL